MILLTILLFLFPQLKANPIVLEAIVAALKLLIIKLL